MQLFCTNRLALWLALIIASTFQPSSATCLHPSSERSSNINRATLAKRAILFPPRVVFIPIIGPITFNNIFDWGTPMLGNQNVPVDSRVQATATQALEDVVEEYAQDHPEDAKDLSLDMRELWLEESGQLPKSDREQVKKARKDLQQFFEKHPELKTEAKTKFESLVDNLSQSHQFTDSDDQDQAPKSWAHINPNDE